VLCSVKDHVHFQYLDLRGGRFAAQVAGSDHVKFLDCDIGRDSFVGLQTASDWWVHESDHGEIARCMIESGFAFDYDFMIPGPTDGILMQSGTNDWIVRDSKVSNWGHNCICLSAMHDPDTISRIGIYGNDLSAPNTSYCRAFSVEGLDGLTGDNRIHHNECHHLTVKSQLASHTTEVYENHFGHIVQSPAVQPEVGMGLSLEVYGDCVCTENRIYNNEFADIEGPGMLLTASGGPNDVRNNLIRCNTFINCGTNSPSYPDIALVVDDDVCVKTNVFQHNDFQGPNDHVVSYRGTICTVDRFNEILSEGDAGS